MGGIVAAWAVGLGIVSVREARATHGPPMPGALLAASGIFALLALLAQADRARFLATALAWGFDLAAFANLYAPVTGPSSGTAILGTGKRVNVA